MADTKITGLTDGDPAQSGDEIPINRGGADRKITAGSVAALFDASGYQPLDADLTSWAGVTRASGFDTFAATPSLSNLGALLTNEAAGLITFMTTPSSANLRALLTDEAGTGAAYFAGGVPGTIGITIDGGGSAITTGVKGYVTVPFACTITEWYLTGDVSGAIKIDVWVEDFATGLPDNSDSITNGNEPEITASGTKASDTDLGNWTTTSIAANDIVGFNVDSCSSITKATLVLKVLK